MVGRMRRGALHGLCALTLAALVPAAAHAGLTTPPLPIDGALDQQFAAPDGGALHAGAADDGDVVAAWRDQGSAPTPVKLLLWRAGAAVPEVTSFGLGSDPDVAMTPDGRAIATWIGSDGRLRIARRTPGGGWPAPTAIDPPAPSNPDSSRWLAAAVAVRLDGTAVVAATGCADYGISAENDAYALDVGADGAIGAPQDSSIAYSSMGCGDTLSVRAAAGPGGQVAVTQCHYDFSCALATRASAAAAWAERGVDGVNAYGNDNGAAVPVITPAGKVVVTWRSDNPAPSRVRASIGTTATAMTQLYDLSDSGASSSAGEPFVFGGDVLALFQTTLGGGGAQVLSRPVFGAGTLGAVGSIAATSFAGDPHGAAWPDGSGVIAYASQPTAGATPQLALVRRSLGGTLTPIDASPLAGRAVSLPRVALAGSAAQPLGVVATREAPVGGGPATIVLRRIDGVPPALALAVPAVADAGAPVAFTATTSDASGPVAVRWELGDGATASGQTVRHVYAAVGRRTVTATATDAAGNVATASATVRVEDHARPAIAGARLTATRFRVARGATPLTARRGPPAGTTLKLTLSEPASLRIAVVRPQAGRRAHGRCRAGARRGRRCTARTTLGTLSRRLGSGPAAIAFSGRLGRRALRPGGYELRLVAADAAGNRSRAVVVRFTIVR